MKPLYNPVRSKVAANIEPLEARIAPARTIIVGVPNNPTNPPDTEYNEDPFVNTEANPADLISAAVGGGIATVADTFYLRLSKGDQLQIFNNTGSVETALKVQKGNLVAFFVDMNLDNEVQEAELTGIALGKNTKFELRGTLSGDIIANLDEKKTSNKADDTLDMSGIVSQKQSISGIRTGGSVGKIIAGGNIKNLVINGQAQSVLAGSAADGESFRLFTGEVMVPGAGGVPVPTPVPGGTGTMSVNFGEGISGTSISKVQTRGIVDRIEAGGGGFGAKGGNLSDIQVLFDSDGFSLLAGPGGDSGGGKVNAGNGGNVTDVYISGVADITVHDQGNVIAANGGNSATGKGGKGGKLKNIYFGYNKVGGKVFESDALSADAYLAKAGDGGDGKVGGQGGGASLIRMLASTREGNGDEMAVIAGNGGGAVVAGKGAAGKGGAVKDVILRNSEVSPGGDIRVQGGNGGPTLGSSKGAAGGSVMDLRLSGYEMRVFAGDGSDGSVGGNGASVKKVRFLSGPGVLPNIVLVNAGAGGDGSAGNGGNGGDITDVAADDGDFFSFLVNSGNAADGGMGIGGKGGRGGNVKQLRMADVDYGQGANGELIARAGAGAAGDKGGGKGGGFSSVDFFATDMSGQILAGPGGMALIKGNGGHGGGIEKTTMSSTGNVLRMIGGVPTAVSVPLELRAGPGGDGAGMNGNGGDGGDVKRGTYQFDGSVQIYSGFGGMGSGNGAGGDGGNIFLTEGFAKNSFAELVAGSAGAGGSRPANGGSITGLSTTLLSGVFSLTDIRIVAGNGTAGGKGGSLKFIGYGSTSEILVPTPIGNIDILAGHGSASSNGNKAGHGGSINFVSGAVSSGIGTRTTIAAGDGADGVKKAGKGGLVSNLLIERGGNLGVLFTVDAGNGGSASAANGARGGDVTNIVVADVDDLTIFRSVAAGDGGDGLNQGGKGGSVKGLRVDQHGIGIRTGAMFGYSSMGGIFVGAGGNASSGPGGKGKAGSVISVTADYIASVVAGKSAIPEAAEKVQDVDVSGINHLRDSFGSFAGNGLPGGDLVFTFGAESTPRLPQNSTPSTIEAELNALPSVAAAGGVTVVSAPPAGYLVTFIATGDQVQIMGDEVVDITAVESPQGIGGAALFVFASTEGNLVTREVQEFTIQRGFAFSLEFGPDSFSLERTPPLPASATAIDVENALNALAAITAAGGVTVVQNGEAFTVTFNNNGDQPLMSATTYSSPGLVTTLVEGSLANQVIEIQSFSIQDPRTGTENSVIEGNRITVGFGIDSTAFNLAPGNPLPSAAQMQTALNSLLTVQNVGGVTVGLAAGTYTVTFNQPGDFPNVSVRIDGLNDPNPGNNGINTAPHISTIQEGNQTNGVQEVQRVFVATGTQFRLTFGADSSSQVPDNVSAAALEQQLNLMPSIVAIGGVTVTGASGGPYDIVFQQANNYPKFKIVAYNVEQLVTQVQQGANDPAVNEVQQLSYNALGEFSVGFGVDFTALFQGATVTDTALEAALNNLASIQAIGGVSVDPGPDPDTFAITFNTPGDQLPIESRDRVFEAQSIDLFSGGQTVFQFQFGANPPELTAPLTLTGDFAADSTAINNALNALPSVILAGGVNATISLGGIVNVLFLNAGDQTPIVATQVFPMNNATVRNGDGTFTEIQQSSIPNRGVFDPNYFATANFIGSFSDAGDINAGVFRFTDNNGNGIFDSGDAPIDGLVMAKFYDQAKANVIPEARLVGDFTHTTLTAGAVGVQEVQQVSISAKSFYLLFGGHSTTLIKGNASAKQVAKALNALPSIVAAGGVTVERGGVGEFKITFRSDGDQTPITAFHDYLNILG